MSSPRDFYHDGQYHQHQSPNGSEIYPVGIYEQSGTSLQRAPTPRAMIQAQRYELPTAQQPVYPRKYSSATPSPPRSRHADFSQSRRLEPQGQCDDVVIVRPQTHMPHPNNVPPHLPSYRSSHTTYADPDYAILDSPPRRNPSQPLIIPAKVNLPTDGRRFSVVAVGRVRRPATSLDDKRLRDTSAGPQRVVSGVAEFCNEPRQESDNDEDEDNDLDDYALGDSIYSDSGMSDYCPPVPSREHGHAVPKERSAFDSNESSWSPFN